MPTYLIRLKNLKHLPLGPGNPSSPGCPVSPGSPFLEMKTVSPASPGGPLSPVNVIYMRETQTHAHCTGNSSSTAWYLLYKAHLPPLGCIQGSLSNSPRNRKFPSCYHLSTPGTRMQLVHSVNLLYLTQISQDPLWVKTFGMSSSTRLLAYSVEAGSSHTPVQGPIPFYPTTLLSLLRTLKQWTHISTWFSTRGLPKSGNWVTHPSLSGTTVPLQHCWDWLSRPMSWEGLVKREFCESVAIVLAVWHQQ